MLLNFCTKMQNVGSTKWFGAKMPGYTKHVWSAVCDVAFVTRGCNRQSKMWRLRKRKQNLWCQPCKVTASSSGAVRVRRLAQGHLDSQLGGAGDQTSNLPVTSQPKMFLFSPRSAHTCCGYHVFTRYRNIREDADSGYR